MKKLSKGLSGLEKLWKLFVCVMPAVLFFSYYPIISLGSDATMNFELSVPLLWLVVFNLVGLGVMIRRGVLFKGLKGKWGWILFPVWVTLSVIWSLNVVRGVLTAGILWLIYFAVYGMWSLRELFDVEFLRRFWRWFFGATLVVCAWCVAQCVLDLAGVAREYTLMCAGCTYRMFGFPHPNGFAVEPQFMGNLLLAPAMIVACLRMSVDDMFHSWPRPSGPSPRADGANPRAAALRNATSSKHGRHFQGFLATTLLVIFAFTLFLTFSRGAIYAFGVGMVVMSVGVVGREKKRRRGEVAKRVGWAWVTVVVSFLLALGVQGLMAEVSPTDDTFATGVGKVLNHLSLGVIDVRGGESQEEEMGENVSNEGVVEKSVENSEREKKGGSEMSVDEELEEDEKAAFDGYVAESTDTRLRLTGSAVEVWRQDFATAMFGVGLGGAGQALYNNGLSPAPKEIVQNEYASLLLETGLVGVSLLVLTLVLVVRAIWKSPARAMLIGLMVAYVITLCFFSGLPNALQIYLMMGVLVVLGGCSW